MGFGFPHTGAIPAANYKNKPLVNPQFQKPGNHNRFAVLRKLREKRDTSSASTAALVASAAATHDSLTARERWPRRPAAVPEERPVQVADRASRGRRRALAFMVIAIVFGFLSLFAEYLSL